MASYYFTIYDDGSTGWAYTDAQPVLTSPGHFVTYAEYSVKYIENAEARYQQELTRLNADVAEKTSVRDAYVSMGVPLATANVMSGYTGVVAARDQHVADHDSYLVVRPSAAEVAADE